MIITDLSNSFNPVPKTGQKKTESPLKSGKYYKTENFVQIFGKNYL